MWSHRLHIEPNRPDATGSGCLATDCRGIGLDRDLVEADHAGEVGINRLGGHTVTVTGMLTVTTAPSASLRLTA